MTDLQRRTSTMSTISRRQFLQFSAAAGGAMAFGDLADQVLGLTQWAKPAYGAEPIKIGIVDPLSSPYKTSSIHDVHGATVALEMYNKRGGVLGHQVSIVEADDASNVQTAIKVTNKLIKEDRVDILMGTFNGDVALAVESPHQNVHAIFLNQLVRNFDRGLDVGGVVGLDDADLMAEHPSALVVHLQGHRGPVHVVNRGGFVRAG